MFFAGGGVAASGSAWGALVEPNLPVIERVAVKIPRLPTALEGMRIVVMSDFHFLACTTSEQVMRAINLANSLEPDLVLLPGDFLTHQIGPINELMSLLSRLTAKIGVYASLGNHDYWAGSTLIHQAFQQMKIPLLENAGTTLSAHGQDFYIAGLASAWASHPNLKTALDARRRRIPTLLMMHEPDYADQIVSMNAVDLQVSGHSHGGQIRMPGIGALRLPAWGKKYDQGLYSIRDLTLYTTCGIGTVGVPMRLNCPPEITELTLIA